MAKIVGVNQLADELTRTMKKYNDDVKRGIEKETKKRATTTKKEVQAEAPKDRPEYYKYFTRSKRTTSDGLSYTIWNKKYYNLIHLLEFGHAKVGGGRVKAQPHMKPVGDKNIKEYEKEIIKIIKRGG